MPRIPEPVLAVPRLRALLRWLRGRRAPPGRCSLCRAPTSQYLCDDCYDRMQV